METKTTQIRGSFIAAICIGMGILSCATAFAQDYHMSYDNGLITLSADKVDLKTILLIISKETSIFIQFPATLQKQITISLSNVSLKNAFKRLLKGHDYAIIYSGSGKNSISEVRVLPEQWGHRKSLESPTQSRYLNLTKSYNRRLDVLRKRLTTVTRGSDTEKRILRQIQTMERALERLENKLRR